MYFLALLALTAWSGASPLSENSFFTKTTAGLRARSLRITSHVAELQRLSGAGQPSSKYLRTATCTNVMTSGTPNVTANRTLYGQADLISADLGQVFITNVSFGSQVFEAVIDTGSSDTWLVEAGFTCVNQTSNITVTEADCLFGSAGYKPDSTFTPISDENFNVSYADGEYLNGIMGYDKVTFAGITIQKQEVGLADLAGWDGDTVSSGLVGLAFPSLTSAFADTNALADNFTVEGTAPGDHEPYSSLINTIFFVQNLTQPQFSLALSRDESNTSYGGIIAIGGYPNPNIATINATGVFASTAVEVLSNNFLDPDSAPVYQFYAISVSGLEWESNNGTVGGNNTATQFIVDSGTTVNYVPTGDAAAFNALFSPPAVLDEDLDIYSVDCNATAPSFAVIIDEEYFLTNPLDLILPNGDGTCMSGVQDGGPTGPYILGDVFLKNVLAVFDLTPGNYEMHFSPRVYYGS